MGRILEIRAKHESEGSAPADLKCRLYGFKKERGTKEPVPPPRDLAFNCVKLIQISSLKIFV